jgi:hypothetical protein
MEMAFVAPVHMYRYLSYAFFLIVAIGHCHEQQHLPPHLSITMPAEAVLR